MLTAHQENPLTFPDLNITIFHTGVSVYYRLADPRIMQAFDLITEVMLSHMAREEALRREFAERLQEPASEVE